MRGLTSRGAGIPVLVANPLVSVEGLAPGASYDEDS